MSTFDDYLTHDDKPYAENINDALLLSNVFDLTVPIELPTMFKNGYFNTSTSPRKAGVSIFTIVSYGNLTITNSSISNSESDAQTLVFKYYPNFNSYGTISSLSWTTSGTGVTADIEGADGEDILTGHTGGTITGATTGLTKLQEFTITLNIPAGVSISKINFVMENKDETRYGAECGITDVTGLTDALAGKSNTGHTHTKSDITDLVIDGTLSSSSTNPIQNKTVKAGLDGKANSSHTHNKSDLNNFNQNVVDLIYPVGSIYISTISTSPATLFGRGTWQEIQGRFLLGRDNSHSAGSAGGESTVTLSIDQMPSHNHAHSHYHTLASGTGQKVVTSNYDLSTGDTKRVATANTGGNYYVQQVNKPTLARISNTDSPNSLTTTSTGGGQAHNNMPPYLVVYMWKRTG